MEEKKLTAKDIPMGYPLCFNDKCTEKGKCMHYQARLLMPKGRKNVLFPWWEHFIPSVGIIVTLNGNNLAPS